MSLIAFLIILFITGLIVGALGRLLLPGPDPMSLLETAGVGIAGSFIAGFIGLALFHRHGGGIILSIICTMFLVWVVRRMRERNAGPMRRGGFMTRR